MILLLLSFETRYDLNQFQPSFLSLLYNLFIHIFSFTFIFVNKNIRNENIQKQTIGLGDCYLRAYNRQYMSFKENILLKIYVITIFILLYFRLLLNLNQL